MTITYHSSNIIRGTSADRTGGTWTNLPAGYLFIEDTPAIYYWSGSAWVAAGGGGGGGEANTASNVGTGQGVFKTKSGVDLQFRSLTATSTKVALANNTNDVGLDVTEANLTLQNLGGTLTVAKGGTGLSTFGDAGIDNTASPYTMPATVNTLRVDATAGNVTVNLPTAAGITGKIYTIHRSDILASTNLVTIDAASTETIEGNLTHILYNHDTLVIESDGTNWNLLTRTAPSFRGYYLKGATANRRYVAGRIGNEATVAVSTTSPAANTLWAMPLFVEKTTRFDTISFMVTTLSTAGSARVGIYRDNGNMFPGALLFDSGAVDTSTGTTAAVRDVTITSSLQIFQPGVYWLTFETNSATGQYMVHTTAAPMFGFAGFDNTFTTAFVQGFGWTVAHTFGALPDPYTTSATLMRSSPSVTTNAYPMVGLRPV